MINIIATLLKVYILHPLFLAYYLILVIKQDLLDLNEKSCRWLEFVFLIGFVRRKINLLLVRFYKKKASK